MSVGLCCICCTDYINNWNLQQNH